MQIFKVIGSVTLNRSHASYIGARLLATVPVGSSVMGGPEPIDPDLVVVWDDLGAGPESWLAVADGAEAAQPFRPEPKAVDAYNSSILDEVQFAPEVVKALRWSP